MKTLFSGERFSFLRRHFTLMFLILLVCDEENESIRICIILNLIKPTVQVHEAVHARQVVSEKNSVGTTVENLRDRLEALLPSCVPDLQLEGEVLHTNEKGAELYTNRHFVVLRELIVAHAVHEARLADA